MNELMKFDFQFQDKEKNVHVDQDIRVIEINGEPWFVGADVCQILEHTNASSALSRLKDYEKKYLDPKHYLGSVSNQEFTAISESGLYRLVLTSRKPQAEPFQDWVCQEVLPQIRKTGGYNLAKQNSNIPQDYVAALRAAADAEEARLLAEAAAERLEAEADYALDQLDQAESTLDSYRALLSPECCLDVTQVAKGLGILGLGRNKLFDYLRSKKFVQQKPSTIPYQRRIDDEQAVVETVSVHINGEDIAKQKTKVTFRGLEYIINSLIKDGYSVNTTAKAIWDYYNVN